MTREDLEQRSAEPEEGIQAARGEATDDIDRHATASAQTAQAAEEEATAAETCAAEAEPAPIDEDRGAQAQGRRVRGSPRGGCRSGSRRLRLDQGR